VDIRGWLQQQRQPLGVGARPLAIDGVEDRPNLDRAVSGRGDVARQSQRVVEVFGFEHVIAAGDLGGLGERAVGDVGASGPPLIRTPVAAAVSASPARIADPALAWKSW
jgi:hypothetical protein